jgi:hypothetical protein
MALSKTLSISNLKRYLNGEPYYAMFSPQSSSQVLPTCGVFLVH